MLNDKTLDKISKITQLVDKLEIQEKEEKKKIAKHIDNNTYSTLLKFFYKNHEITTIISQEIFEIIEELDLVPISEILQKIMKNFQIQLNKFLLYQYHYLRFIKIKKDGNNTNSNSLLNIISENELPNFEISQSKHSVDSINLTFANFQKNNNKNLNKMENSLKTSFSVIFQNFKSKFQNNNHTNANRNIAEATENENKNKNANNNNNSFRDTNTNQIPTENSQMNEKIEESKTTEEEDANIRTIEREKEMADMNHILDTKEKRMEQLMMVEARNIAAHSELVNVRNDIHKNKNSQVIYTGENLDFLVETEKMKKVPETITEADDDILRIPYFSKTGNKVLKQSVNVTKVVKEKEENEKLSENFLSSSHKSRVKVTQHDLRSVQKNTLYKNKGTEPDPEIFDINQIYALDILLQRKNDEIYKKEEEITQNISHIRELEALNELQKAELKSTRENLEKTLTRLAEMKLNEANINFEDNNLKKIILDLKKEIGLLELKCEKKDEDYENLNISYQLKKQQHKELEKKNEILNKENNELKKQIQFLNLDNQKRNENLEENEKRASSMISNLEKEIKFFKKNSIDEMQAQENYIQSLQGKLEFYEVENKELREEINALEHKLTIAKIEHAKSFLTPRDSRIANLFPAITSPLSSPRKNTEEKSEEMEKASDSSKYSKKFNFATSKNPQNNSKHSKETQTNVNEGRDCETQTGMSEAISPKNEINMKISDPIKEKNMSVLESFLKPSKNTNKYIKLEENNNNTHIFPSKNTVNSPANILNELIQPSPIIFPTKIKETSKQKSQKILIFENKYNKPLKDLEIKVNQSVENPWFSASKTERTESNSIKSTKNFVENHERHLSLNEKTFKTPKNLYYEGGSKSVHDNEKQIGNHNFNENPQNLVVVEEKSVFEMNMEEKEKRINQMFIRFQKKQENKSQSRKTNLKNNKEEFKEEKMLEFNEFRDFFLKFVEIHRKCGKDCSHLKRFYEKIGWTEEKTSIFRKEIKPIKKIISSLPRINN